MDNIRTEAPNTRLANLYAHNHHVQPVTKNDQNTFSSAMKQEQKPLWQQALDNIKFYESYSGEADFDGDGTNFGSGDKQGIINALKTLAGTQRGSELLQGLVNSPEPLRLVADEPKPFAEREHNLIHFDGRDRYNSKLKMHFPAAIILAHEMGHLKFGGLHQDHVNDGLLWGGPTNNIEINENPIRKELGLPLREYYIESKNTPSKADDSCYSANGKPTICPSKLGYNHTKINP